MENNSDEKKDKKKQHRHHKSSKNRQNRQRSENQQDVKKQNVDVQPEEEKQDVVEESVVNEVEPQVEEHFADDDDPNDIGNISDIAPKKKVQKANFDDKDHTQAEDWEKYLDMDMFASLLHSYLI